MTDPIRTGGLMRCCCATIDDYYDKPVIPKPAQDDILRCEYCASSMIFRYGCWEWNREGVEAA